MNWQNIRIGQGYDIHPLKLNRKLVLGGIEIPFSKGLDGHSDADVLIHAICDALLGAANLGELGKYFPSNETNKNIKSSEILKSVVKIIAKENAAIINIDTTVIAESPKLSSYIPNIKANLAKYIAIEADKISIKAKTKEGQDSVGKGDAIEVFAVVLLYKQ